MRPEYHDDLDYLVSMLDWEGNVNPEFGMSNRVFPRPLQSEPEAAASGYREQWVCYGTPWYSAKELTVMPKRTVTIGMLPPTGSSSHRGMARSDGIMCRRPP